MRAFGGEQKPEDDYGKKFESLLNKSSGPISDAEKQNIESMKEAKARMDAE